MTTSGSGSGAAGDPQVITEDNVHDLDGVLAAGARERARAEAAAHLAAAERAVAKAEQALTYAEAALARAKAETAEVLS